MPTMQRRPQRVLTPATIVGQLGSYVEDEPLRQLVKRCVIADGTVVMHNLMVTERAQELGQLSARDAMISRLRDMTSHLDSVRQNDYRIASVQYLADQVLLDEYDRFTKIASHILEPPDHHDYEIVRENEKQVMDELAGHIALLPELLVEAQRYSVLSLADKAAVRDRYQCVERILGFARQRHHKLATSLKPW